MFSFRPLATRKAMSSSSAEHKTGQENKIYEEWLRELRQFNLKQKEAEGGLIIIYNHLKEGCRREVFGPFSQVTSDKVQGNSLTLCLWRFRLDIRKNFFTENLVRHWNRLHREVVGSPCLEVLKRHMDVVLHTCGGEWS